MSNPTCLADVQLYETWITFPPVTAKRMAFDIEFKTRILPVVVLDDAELALPLAEALLEGGIDAMEITLRRACALDAISRVRARLPEMCVGAGTLTRPEDFSRAAAAGARFGVSPGLTPALAAAAQASALAFIPGVMTPSEVIAAREQGYALLKLFPAGQIGGLSMLKALASPFAGVRFCPTGGVSAETLLEFLRQPNVAMVGGSWLTPADAVRSRDWKRVAGLAREAGDIALAAGAAASAR
jgi:2-dehydro-3-deoxyphosphogluconate aldolase/(4S)-4-hydroxy-2-oxoglutarate aldolase